MDLRFINVTTPDQLGSQASRSLVRYHAAKATHAKARRERVRRYNEREDRASNHQARNPVLGTGDPYFIPEGGSGLQACSPTSVLVSARWDPFDSFSKKTSILEHWLFDHYIRVVVPLETGHSHQFSDPESYKLQITTRWVSAAIADPGMLNGLLLYACRSLCILTGKGLYRQLALQYKLACLQSLSQAISCSDEAQTVKDSTIAKALQMASDELCVGDIATCKAHMDGIVKMVKLNGGLANIRGMSGFLRQMVSVFACKEQLRDMGQSPG